MLLIIHILVIEIEDGDEMVVGETCRPVGVQLHRGEIVVDGLPHIPLLAVSVSPEVKSVIRRGVRGDVSIQLPDGFVGLPGGDELFNLFHLEMSVTNRTATKLCINLKS